MQRLFACFITVVQGMDANNERNVFDIIVRTAVATQSQYFLFSPKLLKNLNYTSKMTILVIGNGPMITPDWCDCDEDEDD